MFQNTAKKLHLWCTLLTWILTSCHIFLRMFKFRKNCDFISRTGVSFCHLSLTSGIKPVDGHHQKCLTDLYRHKLHIVWLLMQAIFDTTKPKKEKKKKNPSINLCLSIMKTAESFLILNPCWTDLCLMIASGHEKQISSLNSGMWKSLPAGTASEICNIKLRSARDAKSKVIQ